MIGDNIISYKNGEIDLKLTKEKYERKEYLT